LVFYRSSGDSGLEVLKSRFLLPFRGIATWSDSAFHLSSAPLRGNRIFCLPGILVVAAGDRFLLMT